MKKIFLSGLIFLVFITAYSQTDTIIVSKESPDSVYAKYDMIYKLFIEENNHEIKHLWKIDLLEFEINLFNLTLEQKIGKCFSSETGLIFAYTRSNTDVKIANIVPPLVINQYAPLSTNLYRGIRISGTEKIKYYYNLTRRVQKGKNTNGFAGNYFSFHAAAQYGSGYAEPSLIIHKEVFVYGFGIGYGLQRRIGNIGYFEPSFAFDFFPNYMTQGKMSYNFAMDLNIGFAIDSFSNLKRMLKK